MFRNVVYRIKCAALHLALSLLFFSVSSSVFAQEPPLDPPKVITIGKPDGMVFGDWVFSPTMRMYSLFDSNLYLSALNPVSAAGVRFNPDLYWRWTDGIHTSTIYGSLDRKFYPSLPASNNVLDGNTGVIQKYEALRDIIFTAQLDFTHVTNSSPLLASIPSPLANPTAPPPPPSGSVAISGPTTAGNPSDALTGFFSVEKIFNRADLKLTAAIARTEFEKQPASDFNTKTFTQHGAAWLGPLLYVYADAVESSHTTLDSNTNTNRIIAGFGSARIGLFRAQIYAGHQGSNFEGSESSGSAGGPVSGARVSYEATRFWKLNFSVDTATNISNTTSASSLAQTPLTPTILLIPLSASTRIVTISGRSDYALSKRWSAYARVDYTHVDFIGSANWENAWLTAAGLRYEIRRNTVFTLDYENARIESGFPLTVTTRNYIMAGTVYKF
jgi:hypothetical protein